MWSVVINHCKTHLVKNRSLLHFQQVFCVNIITSVGNEWCDRSFTVYAKLNTRIANMDLDVSRKFEVSKLRWVWRKNRFSPKQCFPAGFSWAKSKIYWGIRNIFFMDNCIFFTVTKQGNYVSVEMQPLMNPPSILPMIHECIWSSSEMTEKGKLKDSE